MCYSSIYNITMIIENGFAYHAVNDINWLNSLGGHFLVKLHLFSVFRNRFLNPFFACDDDFFFLLDEASATVAAAAASASSRPIE